MEISKITQYTAIRVYDKSSTLGEFYIRYGCDNWTQVPVYQAEFRVSTLCATELEKVYQEYVMKDDISLVEIFKV